MKKILLLLAMGTAIGASAQVEPLNQYLNKQFIGSLVAYDSISVSQDSGSAFSTILACNQHYFTNGHIDTLNVTQAGMSILSYKGTIDSNRTEITGFLTVNGAMDSIDRLVFYQNVQYRDSVLESYSYNNGWVRNFQGRIFYNANNAPDHIDIYADAGGSLAKIGDYTYFYKSQMLDSLYYTVNTSGNFSDGYYHYVYDPSNPGRLLKMELHEDIDNDGVKDLIQRLLFKNNASDKIVELIELDLDPNSGSLVIGGDVRYGVRKKSTISLPEATLSKVSLFPNPASKWIEVDYNKNLFTTYEIININGQIVDAGIATPRIKVASLPKGNYILSLKGERGYTTQRFEKL